MLDAAVKLCGITQNRCVDMWLQGMRSTIAFMHLMGLNSVVNGHLVFWLTADRLHALV